MNQNLLHFQSWRWHSQQAFPHGSSVLTPAQALDSVVINRRYCTPSTAIDLTTDNRSAATENNPIIANVVVTAKCSNLDHIISPLNTHIATTIAVAVAVSAPLSSS